MAYRAAPCARPCTTYIYQGPAANRAALHCSSRMSPASPVQALVASPLRSCRLREGSRHVRRAMAS
eukprot:scaffold884_cov398-Prasinococcus_capsulatus_cf.AAC.32